jgi:hypothetical protein
MKNLDERYQRALTQMYNDENKYIGPDDFPYDLSEINAGVQYGNQPQFKTLEEEKPGFIETTARAFWKVNPLANAGKFTLNTGMDLYYLSDPVPDGWNTNDPEIYKPYPEKYWPRLRDSASPKDLERRKEQIEQEMYFDQRLNDGSYVAQFIGGAAGLSATPFLSSVFLPTLSSIKYGKLGQNILQNVIQATPKLTYSSLATEGLMQAASMGGNLQDAMVDSFRDVVFGDALVGAGSAFSSIINSSKVWNARKVLNMSYDGSSIEQVVNEKGELVGHKFVPGERIAGNAQKVQEGTEAAQNMMAMSGAFAVPGLGKGLAWLGGHPLLGSPLVRGLTSQFKAVQNFTNTIAKSSIRTQDVIEGIARPDSAEDIRSFYQAMGSYTSEALKSHYYNENGLTSSIQTVNAVKNLTQTFTEGKNVSWEEFGQRVRQVIITGESDVSANINNAAKDLTDTLERFNRDYAEAHGTHLFESPKNAVNYIFQNWNIEKLMQDPEGFVNICVDGFKLRAKQILELQQPVKYAQDEVDRLTSILEAPDFETETRALVNERKVAVERLNKAKEELDTKLRNNEDYHYLLEDRIILNTEEKTQLKELFSDVNQAKYEQIKAEKDLENLKKSLSSEQSRIKKGVDPLEREKSQMAIKEYKKAIDAKTKELDLMIEKVQAEQSKIESLARTGKINQRFFTLSEGKVNFRDLNATPKFAKVHSSEEEMRQEANAWIQHILGNTPERLIDNVIGHNTPGYSEAPNPVRARTILLPQKLFNQVDGYLDNDLTKAIGAYANSMGRRIGLKKAFGESYGPGGIEDLLRGFQQEYDAKRAQILAKPASKQRAKELTKLSNDFKKDQKLMRDMYEVYHGRYQKAGTDGGELVGILRNLTFSAKMGAVTVSQLTDITAITLRNGVLPWMVKGIIPHIKSLNGRLNTPEGEAIRDAAAKHFLGLNHVNQNMMAKWFGTNSMSYQPGVGRLAKATENIAHLSSNFYGTNALENLNELMAASAVQSDIMKAVFAHLDGTITKDQQVQMAGLGIQLEDWANRFAENYKKSGGYSQFNNRAFESNWFDWEDIDAVNRMAMSVRRGVEETVVKRTAFTSPLWTNDPILGTLFMFHGWSYGATARYLIPMLQRPDAQHLTGILMMSMVSVWQDPLRRLANGKPAFEDEDTLANVALRSLMNNGVLGVVPEAFEGLNLALNNQLLPKLQGERYKERGPSGKIVLGGAALGYVNDTLELIRMVISGQINENDMKRSARLLPFVGSLYTRGLLNKWIESLNLPKTRAEAKNLQGA